MTIRKMKTEIIAVLTAVIMAFAVMPFSMGQAYAEDNITNTFAAVNADPDKPAAKAAAPLPAKMTAKGKKSMTISWSKFDGAQGYDIFLAKSAKSKGKKIKAVKGNKKLSYTKKKLKAKTSYKAYVKAWVMQDGKKKYTATSPTVYAYTTGGTKKYTNPKSVTVDSADVVLAAGETHKINAAVTKLRKGRKLLTIKQVPKLRYLSSDQEVAAVSGNGMITAKAGGTCKIYVYAVNGARKAVSVTVTPEEPLEGAPNYQLSYENTISDLEPYLKSTAHCHVNSDSIKTTVNRCIAGLGDDQEKADALFNYVRDNISYSFYYDTRYGAVGTLNLRSGNDVDQAHLLIAMLRAAGIPARYHHGTCTFTDGSTRGHVWAECLIGSIWIDIDTTSSSNSFGAIMNWNTNTFTHHNFYLSLEEPLEDAPNYHYQLSYKNTISNLEPYLKPTTHCQVNNDSIKTAVNSCIAGLGGDQEKAAALFNYVRDNISYSFYYNTRYGAVGTLNARSGNDVDQAHLLIAMLRTAGIPARYHHGTCAFTDGSTRGHVWAECLIGSTWIDIDTTSSSNSFGAIMNWNTNTFTHHNFYASLPDQVE